MGGEAGDGVDLVKDDLPRRGEEQVHPGEVLAVQGTVDGLGRRLDLRRLFRRDAGGTVDGGGFQGVFLLKVEETLGELDLVHRAHGELVGAQHRAAHLEAGDGLLQQDLPVVGEGGCRRPGQPLGGGDPGDTERGPRPDRLHKEGVAQLVRRRPDLPDSRAPAEHRAAGDPHAGQGGQLVGPVLVHAQGGGQGAAADDRDPRQLQQALEGTVLPVLAVEHREGGVEGQLRAAAVQQDQPGHPRLRARVQGTQWGPCQRSAGMASDAPV